MDNQSNIQIIDIDDPIEYLTQNEECLYIYRTIGMERVREMEKDFIRKQIDTLALNYEFNINETIFFRTFDPSIILVYILMEQKLYLIESTKPIMNMFVLIDGYFILLFEHTIEVINIREMTTNVFVVPLKKHIELLWEYQKLAIEQNGKPVSISQNKNLFELSKDICGFNYNQLVIKNKLYDIERIWSIFTLQTKICSTYSVIENNKRFFKYSISLDTQDDLQASLIELIEFMNINFYQQIRDRVLISKDIIQNI